MSRFSNFPAPGARALIAAVALCWGFMPAQAAEAAKPAAAASAAPAPAKPTPLSAAEAARLAEVPGQVRPATPVVPQIVLPLRQGAEGQLVSPLPATGASGTAKGAGSANAAPGIDDTVARCAAQKTKADRRACKEEAKISSVR